MKWDAFPTTPAGRAQSFDLIEVIRVIRRRRVIILLTVALVTGAALLFAMNRTPQFTATTVAMVAAPVQPNVTQAQTATDPLYAQRAAAAANVLSSRWLARHVVDKLSLTEDSEFNPPTDDGGWKSWLKDLVGVGAEPEAFGSDEADDSARVTTRRLLEHIGINHESASNVVEISVTTTDPAKSARIADTLAKSYMETQTSKQVRSVRKNVNYLEKRVADLRQQALDLEQAAARYRQQNRLLSDDSADSRGRIDRLDAHLAVARAARLEAEARFRGLGSAMRRGSAPDSAAIASPVLSDLRSQEAALGRRIAELSTQYGPGHPDVSNAAAQLDDVRARIRVEVGRLGEGMRTDIAVSQSREADLSRDIGTLRARALSERGASVPLLDLERQAQATNELYLTLLGQLKSMTDREKVQESDLSILSEAIQPDAPDAPSRLQIVSAGFIGSWLFAMFFAFAAEALDSQLRSPEQIERALGVPTFAMVPELNGDDQESPHRYQLEHPRSSYAESIHDLHVELVLQTRSKGGLVVVLTSALPGEGKTTLTLCLATASAKVGRKAVAIELDIRRPALQQLLDGPAEADVIDYLTGKADLEAVLRPHERVPDLWTMSLARSAEDPRSLLTSRRLEELLARLRERFDLVVISAPPVLPVMDARMLAEMADATLLVVRWGQTTRDQARAAAQLLDGAVTAAVLNRVSYKGHARGAFADRVEYYAKYSNYYAD